MESFYGIINIKANPNEQEHDVSMLFTFRKYSEIQKESRAVYERKLYYLRFPGGYLRYGAAKRARTYARENRNIILVNTDDAEINEYGGKGDSQRIRPEAEGYSDHAQLRHLPGLSV